MAMYYRSDNGVLGNEPYDVQLLGERKMLNLISQVIGIVLALIGAVVVITTILDMWEKRK